MTTKKTAAQNEVAPEITDPETPETVNDEAVQEPTNFPEAGGIAWCELYGHKTDEDGVLHEIKINVTSRSINTSLALRGLLETVAEAKTLYNLRPYMKNKTAPTAQPAAAQPSPVAQPVQPVVGAPAPSAQPVQAPEPEYVPVEGGAGGELVANKMTVTPRPDGKSKLEFFMAGHRWADVSAVMTPDQLAGMMQLTGAWTPDHFKATATYDVNYRIGWRPSAKLNSNGQPYRNISTVNPA